VPVCGAGGRRFNLRQGHALSGALKEDGENPDQAPP